jgi:hypothetical protein
VIPRFRHQKPITYFADFWHRLWNSSREPLEVQMKLFIVLFLLSFNALATEVRTDCPAMNQEREKIVKVPGSKARSTAGAIKQ